MISEKMGGFRRSETLGQLIRFGIAGGLSGVIYSLVYVPLSTYVFPPKLAVVAVPFAFIAAVIFGFFAHSRWSFKDYGNRRPGIGQHLRFFAVQGMGLSINGLITWIGTALIGLPPWAPLLPAVLLAAVVTFILNRVWVFC